jgi:acetolactate synthase small subunit
MPTMTFELQVRRRSDALNRIVGVCRRRGVDIVSLTYAEGAMVLSVCGDRKRTRRLRHCLQALVDVVEVRERRQDAVGRSPHVSQVFEPA